MFWINSNYAAGLRTYIRNHLSKELIRVNLPDPEKKVDVIYILGGAEKSLKFKYKTAADIFNKGICKKIWILSRKGKTRYNHSLGRNLTNDEWSLMTLNQFGVPKEYVEIIKIPRGFFGTLSEAKYISSLVIQRELKSILLISSHYHTHRMKITFKDFLDETHNIYIQGSGEKVFLKKYLLEFFKLKIYQYFII